MKKIIIAGGTGFLGECLSKYFLQKRYEVVILSRVKKPDQAPLYYQQWDGKTLGNWAKSLEDAEAVINLTGKSVDCRYTTRNKQLIYSSRLDATRVLGMAIAECEHPPKVWINAASATIYRHSLDKAMDETTGEIGEGFSVDVCEKWEQTFNDQQVPKTRKVILRIAIVLGYKSGALQPLRNLVRIGLGGKQGSGAQKFSWIHEQDFVKIVDFVIENEDIEGVYNVAAPNPVTNKELMQMLRNALKIRFGIPTPAWLLKIGAVLISTETELILKSRYVIPDKLLKRSYVFDYPKLEEAIEDLVNRNDG